MDFLPIKIEDKKVYASFRWRLYALSIDYLILFTTGFILIWIAGKDLTFAYMLTIPQGLFWVMYFVVMNTIYGGTVGKIIAKIRVTNPDGSKIDFITALKRAAVDLFYAAIFIYVQLTALTYFDPQQYASLDWVLRLSLIQEYHPSWYRFITHSSSIWLISELIILIFNKRYRTIHDYIAGTVVIHQQFRKY